MKERLGNHIQQVRGVSYKPNDLSETLSDDYTTLLRANNISEGKINFDSVQFVSSSKVAPEQILKTNDILVCSSSGSLSLVGKSALYKKTGEHTFGAFCKVVRATGKLLPQYIAFYMCSQAYRRHIENIANGANINNLRNEHLDEILLPIPSEDRQNAIIAKLEKVQSVISRRRAQLAKLDELVKCRFVEMFGDPVANDKGWPIVRLDAIADIRIGPFGSLLHKEDYQSGNHALVNPSHIAEGKIKVDSTLSVSNDKYNELSAYWLNPGDIVMGRRGEMGRCAVVEHSGLICGTGSLIIRTHGQMKPYFLQNILSRPEYKKIIEDKAVGVTMMNLNVPIVSSLEVPLLPHEQQIEFLGFTHRIDKLRFVASDYSLREENAYNVLNLNPRTIFHDNQALMRYELLYTPTVLGKASPGLTGVRDEVNDI